MDFSDLQFKCFLCLSLNCLVASVSCGSDEFLCGDQECIPVSWQCDGNLDCSDGLDEWPENCNNRK